MPAAKKIVKQYLHVQDGGKTDIVRVPESFWQDLATGKLPQLGRGRLMSAFTFCEPWSSWERHPAGEELGMLLSGAATLVLDKAGEECAIDLRKPGDYALIPRNVWHTARTSVSTTMLFLTPGAGTEHRPVSDDD